MDNGQQVAVTISIDKFNRSAVVDFTGTSEQGANNFNAPAAVCRAAVLYVFRTLVDDNIPMNEGCLKPIDIILPDGCMLKAQYPAAVIAGNVETSQIVTDALFGALIMAHQGTMNNFMEMPHINITKPFAVGQVPGQIFMVPTRFTPI